MQMDYLTENSKELLALRTNIASVERILHAITDYSHDRKGLDGYLTGKEICRQLHISPRTLQSLRNKRLISFTVVGERTILYPESDLHEMLMRNYRPGKNNGAENF